MHQPTFAEVPFEQYRKSTRREQFLNEMTRVVPWTELVAVIEPVYPKAEGPGRPPVGIERRLRLHGLQQWFTLSDPAVEEALYDSRAMRQFVGLDLGREPVPDEMTICKFWHLLEAHQLGDQLFARIGEYLTKQGLQVSRGTIVDATIISAPRSTKKRRKEPEPEMHQTKKGNQWYFGMKAPIGVDSQTKLIHSVAATAANVHDSPVLPELLQGQETRVWGDSAYSGQRDVIRQHAPKATCFIQAKGHRHRPLSEEERTRNRTKSKVRAKDPTFGYRRLRVLLRCQDGIIVNRKAVYRVLKQKGWFVHQRVATPRPRVRGWVSQASRSNERWAMDVTHIPCGHDGWAHLAAVIDCHNREVIGYEFALRSRATEAERAVEAACLARFGTLRPVGAPVLRSDNGLIFQSRRFRQACRDYRLQQEFITPYTPEQNGLIERFFRSLKEECVCQHTFQTLDEARRVIRDWIHWHNEEGPHSALGYRSLARYRAQLATQVA